MLYVEVETPSPPASAGSPSFAAPGSAAALAALSRNASVISSSSSSSSSSSLLLNTVRPGPIRTFSSPRNRSPTGGASTPTRAKAPLYISKELLAEKTTGVDDLQARRPAISNSTGRLGPNDFEFGEVLGEGSYSTVMAATYSRTRKMYAIKIIDKEHLIRKNMVKIAGVEKNALVRLGAGGHPGIIKLHWAFQDQWSWYFVLDLAPHGELQTQISRLGSICLPCARWYTAQLVDTVAWMHAKGVIHRDLKPENVLLGADLRMKLTDFGSAKLFEVENGDDRSNSWVGTPQYVPPELLLNNTMCKSSDLWAIGCIIYQMISGRFPFQGASNYLMWVKVKTLDYSLPDGFDCIARDLVQRLLVLDPDARLGAGQPGSSNDFSALRAHPFFESIPWDRIWTDPVPSFEAGLVKNATKLPNSGDTFDVGVEWEHLVDGDVDNGDDGDGRGNADEVKAENDKESELKNNTIGPGILSSSFVPPSTGSNPLEVRDTASSQGDSSPSESSPGRLGGIFESLAISSRSRRPSLASNPLTTISDPARWMPLLRPSEAPVFTSCVYKATRRTFPRQLLPLPGNVKKGQVTLGRDKAKVRLLVLTKTRLLCLKERDGEILMKSEVLIGGQGSGVGVVTGVEQGDQSFVVQTLSKAYTYTTEDSLLAARWAKEIREALPASCNVEAEHRPTSDRTLSL
ncbi:kinase-like protein [Ramaria rubella]|nr:kinase-like protein [Ramaria rubella]